MYGNQKIHTDSGSVVEGVFGSSLGLWASLVDFDLYFLLWSWGFINPIMGIYNMSQYGLKIDGETETCPAGWVELGLRARSFLSNLKHS